MAFATSSVLVGNFHGGVSGRRTARLVRAAHVSERVHVAQSQRSGSGSLYDVLGVRIGATCREIKAAYRGLARVVHPDAAGSDGNNGRSDGCEFMKLHEAYATLSDPDTRADYDRVLLTRRIGSSRGFVSRRNWETDQCW